MKHQVVSLDKNIERFYLRRGESPDSPGYVYNTGVNE